VLGADGDAGREIRNGASDTPHAVIRACQEKSPGGRMPYELIAVPVGRAMPIYVTRELRVARGACDRDATGFERLARRSQNITIELHPTPNKTRGRGRVESILIRQSLHA